MLKKRIEQTVSSGIDSQVSDNGRDKKRSREEFDSSCPPSSNIELTVISFA
jgi:hypothetical protein